MKLYRRVDACVECGTTDDDPDISCYDHLPHDWYKKVEPDYEAAMHERRKIAWAHQGYGPYVEKYGDVEINGSTVPRVSEYDETRAIVDAALAEDTP